MKIAIIHYHLHAGGVTRVISSQTQALNGETVRIISGAPDEGKHIKDGTPVDVLPALNYLPENECTDDEFEKRCDEIYAALKNYINDDYVLHVHNPGLCKNPALTFVFYQLAREGMPLVNHCHDFAEDRPENHDYLTWIAEKQGISFEELLYPKAPHLHYAVLTSTDRDRIISYGIHKENVTLLPNPVTAPKSIPDAESARNVLCNVLSINPENTIVTYPVRAIHRKNIGEILLLSTFFENTEWLITLPPQNPEQIPLYEHWKKVASGYKLPVHFNVGSRVPFPVIMAGSDFVITTSIREGFGMAFLEPWLYGTPVVGRNLPDVTRDFMDAGVSFPFLYDHINAISIWSIKDFANLDINAKNISIELDVAAHDASDVTSKLNPHLADLFSPVSTDIINQNAKLISKVYSIEEYGRKLRKIYTAVA